MRDDPLLSGNDLPKQAFRDTIPRMERPCTIREEANALVCCAVRNGYLEELHAGKYSELLDRPELSRISDLEMKRLMIEVSSKLAELLEMKEKDAEKYWSEVKYFLDSYCTRWEK